jgi:hypothetical protein
MIKQLSYSFDSFEYENQPRTLRFTHICILTRYMVAIHQSIVKGLPETLMLSYHVIFSPVVLPCALAGIIL